MLDGKTDDDPADYRRPVAPWTLAHAPTMRSLGGERLIKEGLRGQFVRLAVQVTSKFRSTFGITHDHSRSRDLDDDVLQLHERSGHL